MTRGSNPPVVDQESAGGVVFRRQAGEPEVVLISVGQTRRWQLPKGLVEPGEAPEATAVREVREETGIEGRPLGLIDTTDYWYVGDLRGTRVRFHKRVHFYLLTFTSGDVRDHDHEVHEARWVPFDVAVQTLSFENERRIVERARTMIAVRDLE